VVKGIRVVYSSITTSALPLYKVNQYSYIQVGNFLFEPLFDYEMSFRC
jgi:hypothetical protein